MNHQVQSMNAQNQAASIGQAANINYGQVARDKTLADQAHEASRVLKARVDVLEFFEAQLNMNLFKEDYRQENIYHEAMRSAIKTVLEMAIL